MPESFVAPDCFTYRVTRCYICDAVTCPDDQEVILSGKRYICVCLWCALACTDREQLVR